jgi:tetratricopeptide (TPR) repeat protein
MFEVIGGIVQSLWHHVLGSLELVFETATNINPTQPAVLWVQIIAGSLTVIWIIFQFAWMRRLNESRLERYLESRIVAERDDLAQERSETLAKLERAAKRRGLRYIVLLTWANFRLAFSFVLRMLSLGTVRGLTDHTALLMQVGMLNRARRIYSDVAHDAMRKMRLYEDALANKRAAAQNALIFAGRVAVLEGKPVAAVSAFKKAKRLKDDPDARLLIGKQLAIASDFDGALEEFRSGLADESIGARPATKAELHRSIARILMRQNSPGRARQELTAAEQLDAPQRDYLGMAKTDEILGDLYAPRPRNRRAATQAYEASVKNFEQADDRPRAERVRRKLRKLTGESPLPRDGLLARMLNRSAHALLRIVEKLRARARKRAD